MAEGTQVGSVYLDLQVRDTIVQQVQALAAKAQAAAQRSFADAGKAAGDAMTRGMADAARAMTNTMQQSAAGTQKALTGVVNGAFSKTAATLQAKLKLLQNTLNDNEVRLAQIVEDTARGFTGSPWAAQATESALNANKAYQTLQKQQEKLEAQMEYLRDRLAIEVQAAAAKQAAAEQAAYAKAAQAAENAAKRQQAAARQAHTTAAPPAATRTINTDNAVRADSIASDAEQSANQTRSIWQVALDAVSAKIKSVLGSGLSSLWRSIQSGAVKAGSALLGLAKKLLPFQTGIRKTSTGMQSLAVRLRSIVSGALVFNVISAGLTRMVSAMGTALTSSSQMQSALANLKGAAATAAAPIIQILTPALAALANAAATVFSYLSQLISFFTGKSISAMASTAKGMAGVGSAAGSAAKDIKKANGELASWDELNVLNKQDDASADSAGGGGSGAADILPNYDFQGKSPFLDSILDAIKSGDWYQVGRLIGEKLRDSLNAIPWPDIQEKARQWATNIADTINGFVETPGLWEAIGHTLAQGLNTALYFLDDIVQQVRWQSFGEGLGKGLNQMVAELDWAALGRLLSDKLHIVFETLYGFVHTFNFGNLGLGIATAINAAIGNIPWEQAGEGVSGAVRGILNAFIIAVQNTDWVTLGQSIASMIGSIDWVGIFSDLGQLAISILQAANDLLAQVDWDAIGQTVLDMLSSIDWAGILSQVGELLHNLIPVIIPALLIAAGQAAISIIMAALGAAIMASITSFFSVSVLPALASGLTAILTALGGWPVLLVAAVAAIFVAIIAAIVNNWDKIKQTVSMAWQWIQDKFSQAGSALKNVWSNTWTEISTMTSNIWNGIGETIRGAVNGIISIINGMIQAVVNGINAVIDIINGFSFDVPEFAQETLGTSKIGFDIAKVTAPQIPLLANGGVITQPTLAMMGEYANAGTNPEIAAPQSLLAETVSTSIAPLVAAMAELIEYLRDGGNQEIVIRFAASGGLEQLVRLLKPYIDKEDNRRGGKLIKGGVY